MEKQDIVACGRHLCSNKTLSLQATSPQVGKAMNTVWQFATSPTIRFGRGCLNGLAHCLIQRQIRRPIVVSDPVVLSIPAVESVIQSLDPVVESKQIFAGGQAEPTVATAEAAIAAAKAIDADAVIGIGGGSNMDVAKIVAVILNHGGTAEDYFGFDRIPGPVAPVIAVPTTAGTGSEVSHSAVLTDQQARVKVSTLSPFLRPCLALVDPSLTDSCPPQVTAHSGIDALVHAIEALTNRSFESMESDSKAYEGSYGLTTLLAMESINLIHKFLIRAFEQGNDQRARDGMSYAALLAGMAFSNSGVGLVHALEYPIGALTHCSHGEGNGLLLPYVMEFNKPMCAGTLRSIASIFLSKPPEICSSEDAIDAVFKLQKKLGIRTRLKELGLAADQLASVAEKAIAIERLMTVTARRPTLDDLHSILQSAY